MENIDRFRFRVWYKIKKQMYEVYSVFHNGNVGALVDKSNYETLLMKDNIVLMQWTTLIDKNKKPIYAGDVVKDDYDRIMQVVYRQEWAKFQFMAITKTNFKYADMHEWIFPKNVTEIIGSIYENPELLKN